MQKQIDRNNRRIVYILRKVDELIQQVELKNRQARSILHGNPDQDMVLMAEDMAADADHILLEAMALNVKADKLKKASEVAGEQIDKLLAFQSKRNLDMD
jgi:ethanolamine utilization protein EutA (predicted chaperonin)